MHRLDREDFLDIPFLGDDELEPCCVERTKRDDRFRPESDLTSNSGMRQLDTDVPLVDGDVRWNERTGGLDFDAMSSGFKAIHYVGESGMLQGFTTRHDHILSSGAGDIAKHCVQRRFPSLMCVP